MLLAAADEAMRQHCVRAIKAALAPVRDFLFQSKMQIASAAALKRDLFRMKNVSAVTGVLAVLGIALNNMSLDAAGFVEFWFFHELEASQVRAGGFDAAVLKAAGFTAEEVMQAYELDRAALEKLGYNAAELKQAGVRFPEDLIDWDLIDCGAFAVVIYPHKPQTTKSNASCTPEHPKSQTAGSKLQTSKT